MPTTDKWYTLGHADKLKIEYDDPKIKELSELPLTWEPTTKGFTVKFDKDTPGIEEFYKLLNGDKNDKG